jgi:hypothetical protein
MTSHATGDWDRETALVAVAASCVSIISFLIYLRHGAVLLYGDAVAHINIARRVFDSQTPGPLQLGTVWLPLPHLLMMPFLLSSWAWRTGVGGSIPSMIAYVVGAVGIFCLVRGALAFPSEPDAVARLAGWLAALVYAANLNLLYLQSTAMTEPLYLALFIWAVVSFNEFTRQAARATHGRSSPARSLMKCGACLAGAELTRYDGWFAAVVMGAAASVVVFRIARGSADLRLVLVKFLFLIAAVPVSWLAYNAIIYRNPLEFANGPYSARGIEQRSAQAGSPAHPGSRNLYVASAYFLKSAELNLGQGIWQKLWLVTALAGSIVILTLARRMAALLLLSVPLPFYMLSIAYGGVPIFMPVWWPFSYYNVRYGLQLLPAFAVFTALFFYLLGKFARSRPARMVLAIGALVLVSASYASIWRAEPICLREAQVNSRTRIALESQLASWLRELPPDATLLMYLGDHVGALQQAGIPLRRVINEGNHRTWRRPSDPEGIWERALADPAGYADYAIAFAGDPVWTALEKHTLQVIVQVDVPGQPEAKIFRTGRVSVVSSVSPALSW